jgi:hypothetical protein
VSARESLSTEVTLNWSALLFLIPGVDLKHFLCARHVSAVLSFRWLSPHPNNLESAANQALLFVNVYRHSMRFAMEAYYVAS